MLRIFCKITNGKISTKLDEARWRERVISHELYFDVVFVALGIRIAHILIVLDLILRHLELLIHWVEKVLAGCSFVLGRHPVVGRYTHHGLII